MPNQLILPKTNNLSLKIFLNKNNFVVIQTHKTKDCKKKKKKKALPVTKQKSQKLEPLSEPLPTDSRATSSNSSLLT